MKVVLAISGGIDSMVLLDIMETHLYGLNEKQWRELQQYGCAHPRIIVATFDHGTRPSAEDDAAFVNRVSNEKYQLACFCGQGNLGERVSEADAREERYDFLRKIAQEINDPKKFLCSNPHQTPTKLPPVPEGETYIYTAHHLDDLVETIAINLLRGTGWRGLAVLDAPGIRRPFLEPELLPEVLRPMAPFDKNTILQYAAECDITYRQDPTNNTDDYLRNRVREKTAELPREQKLELYKLWQEQKKLKREINAIIAELLPEAGEPWQRSLFMDLDDMVALELLRAGTLRAGISATRPQLLNFLRAIRTYNSGKSFNLPGDKLIKFSKSSFNL